MHACGPEFVKTVCLAAISASRARHPEVMEGGGKRPLSPGAGKDNDKDKDQKKSKSDKKDWQEDWSSQGWEEVPNPWAEEETFENPSGSASSRGASASVPPPPPPPPPTGIEDAHLMDVRLCLVEGGGCGRRGYLRKGWCLYRDCPRHRFLV